jgi:phosphotransferase system enzyme I (PtsI)
MYKGIGASPGIAIGKAFVMPHWEWEFPERVIDVGDLKNEFERLNEGIRSSKRELNHIKNDIAEYIGSQESNIFDAHLSILEDPIFMQEIEEIIERQSKAAEVAVKEAIDKFANMLSILDDEYMKERALDIKDVGNRLLKHLLGSQEISLPPSDEPYILVAKELTPSQLVHLNPSQVLGIVTMMGGRTSHSVIMARAMSIPYVLGLEGKLSRPIQTGDTLIIDGDEGTLFVNPEEELIERYQIQKLSAFQKWEELQKIARLPAETPDGTSIHLGTNISSIKELDQALKIGIHGVGLFRTEFLYMDRGSLPSEDEQYVTYRQVAEKLNNKPLIIRTLDIGGDKQLDYISLPHEDNPFLGYRAIRISLDREDLFKTQLRAILRASVHGDVKIMYPMISSVEELKKANALLEIAKQELQTENKLYNEKIEVGIMVEIPAAVAIADFLAEEADFFSIGTNDLVQYVLAVDRMNEKIAHLYDPYHPAVIRLLKQTADAAKKHGIPVAVCGEMAGDIRALPIWLGLGIEDLSMSAQSLLQIKYGILNTRQSDCRNIVDEIMKCKTSGQIQSILKNAYEKLQQVQFTGR